MVCTRLSGAVLAGLLLATTAWAQQPQEPAASKIAFVYVQKALASTEDGKARTKELEAWARPKQDELAKLDKDINDLKGELITKQGVASEDAIGELNRRVVAKQREFEDKQRAAKRDFDAKQKALFTEIGGRLQEVITKYADQNRFTAVFILNPDQLAYLANSADITDTVIKLYNERYPLAAAKTTAPAK